MTTKYSDLQLSHVADIYNYGDNQYKRTQVYGDLRAREALHDILSSITPSDTYADIKALVEAKIKAL